MDKKAIYVCGATAVGKTSYAISLAQECDGEIVNGDAFQIYQGMEIISAAPSQAERKAVPHHLFGVLSLGDDCDAGRYSQMATQVMAEILSRGKTPILVGGSGLYLKFLTHGPSPLPQGDKTLRAELDQLSIDELILRLEKLDPTEASRVDKHNPRYVSRALEICILSGGQASEMRDSWAKKTQIVEDKLQGIWLRRDRKRLHQRIALRTEQMLQQGGIEEIAAIQHLSGNWEKAIGVKEIKRFLAGEITLAECAELITIATRQYAKRQETWLRREHWLQEIYL